MGHPPPTSGGSLLTRQLHVETPSGPARVTLHEPGGGGRPDGAADADDTSPGLVLLGHSAGGGIDAPDLQSVTAALTRGGAAVGLVEQPYRVAGRRGAAPAAALDAAMLAVVDAVREPGQPLVLGGRSSGARVACRVATALLERADPDDADDTVDQDGGRSRRAGRVGAAGVLALAFPLRPPWNPEKTRLPELAAVPVPVLIVQGERDHFGGAEDLATVAPPHARVLPVARADHGLKRPLDTADIRAWVLERLRGATPG